MRVSDKARVRQRRIVHGVLILISFSLMFLGKADLAALRNLRMGSNDFLAPVVDVVSAPIRGIETMIEGVRTVAGFMGFCRLHTSSQKRNPPHILALI